MGSRSVTALLHVSSAVLPSIAWITNTTRSAQELQQGPRRGAAVKAGSARRSSSHDHGRREDRCILPSSQEDGAGCAPAGKAFDDMPLRKQQRHFFSCHAQNILLFSLDLEIYSWCSIVLTGWSSILISELDKTKEEA